MSAVKNFYMSVFAAAEELAKHPEYAESLEAQDNICRKYGFSLDELTEDEFTYLSSLVNNLI